MAYVIALPAVLLLLACLLFASVGCATRLDPPPPPTVLLVSVDGLRPADITPAQMPVLNALGDAGVRAAGALYGYGSREELSRADYLCQTPDDIMRLALCGRM